MTVNPIPKYSEFSVLAPVYPPMKQWRQSGPPRHASYDHHAAVQASHQGATAVLQRLSKSQRRWETGIKT